MVPATVEPGTAQEEQRLGEVALAGARVPGDDQPLLPRHEVELRELQHLGFVEPGLEGEVELAQELPLGQAGLLDPPLDPPLHQGGRLHGQQPLEELHRGQPLLGGLRQLRLKDLLDPRQFEGLQVRPDPRQGLVR